MALDPLGHSAEETRCVSALLFANYERVVDPNVIPVMRSLLEHEATLRNFDAIFVKRACKVGMNLIKAQPDTIAGLEERLLEFHREGVARTEADGMPQGWRAHLAGHAADLILFTNEPQPDEQPLQEAYGLYMQSAQLAQAENANFAFVMARDAVTVAKRALRRKKEHIPWMIRHFEACTLLGDIAKSPKDSSEAYMNASREADLLYHKTGAAEWGRAWRDLTLQAAYRLVTHPRGAAVLFADASRVAYEVYAATGSQADRTLAIILCHETAALEGLHPDFYVRNEERRARLLSR